MKLRLNANAIITNEVGHLLIIRLKKGNHKDKLCIPGGGINPGELSFEAAKREIKEETGIEITNQLNPFGFCELIDKNLEDHRVVLLLHSIGSGTPIETEEGIASWEDYEDIKNDLMPFAKEAIRIWKDNSLHFKYVK